MSTYRILSIDGGGIRGVFAARILSRLQKMTPSLIAETDLLAGTSTGAIIAAGLAKGLNSSELVDLYRQQGAQIFRQSILHDFGDLWGLIGAKYGTSFRWQGLYPTFGNAKMSDLGKKVMIATFDLGGGPDISEPNRQWRARFFHNLTPNAGAEDKLINVIMRSSAAPVYFPIYQNFIDGGVVANNPSMCALAQALKSDPSEPALEDIVLLSIGTGITPRFVDSEDGDWGLEQWGFKLIELLLEAGGGLADYQCSQLLGQRYHRIDVQLPAPVGMDDVSKIDYLIALADAYPLDDLAAWVNAYWLGSSEQSQSLAA